MIPHIQLSMSAMSHSATKAKKHALRMSCMCPIITKNLISIGQIVEQGMHARFNKGGCFREKKGRLIGKEGREGWMFMLNSDKVKTAMYAK